MRFLSPITAYRVVAVHQTTEQLADGSRRVLAPGYICEFKQSDTTDWEREEARKRLQFKNVVYEGALGTPLERPVDPITRVSSFDTNVIEDPELRAKVEEALLTNADFGRPDGFILVEKPKRPAPWPSYDDLTIHGRRTAAHVAAQNIETARTIGVELDYVAAYERENRNDDKIVAAYEAAMAEVVTEPEDELVEA